MSSIELTPARIFALKSALRQNFDEVKSSHLTEALAVAIGFNTHAALKTQMGLYAENDAPFVFLNEKKFIQKLQDMNYLKNDPDPDNFYFFEYTQNGVTDTMPLSAFDIKYTTLREKAWRNLLVLSINTGLDKKLFTLRPNDNRWEGWIERDKDQYNTSKDCIFDFNLPDGKPVRVFVADVSFGELSIHVAVNPKGENLKSYNAGFYAGEVFASGWLERERGAWLQSSTSSFNCRKYLLNELANMQIGPKGFGDKGRVIL